MKIGGLQKLSLIDYPGKVCAVVFTQGCNFRCAYCHNPELVIPELFSPCIPLQDVYSFLEDRRADLDGIVVSGGEPTIQQDLLIFIEKIKSMDYAVKLDTNGSKPELLKVFIENKMVDYIAMDVKAPFDKYGFVANCNVDIAEIERSVKLITDSQIEHEFRTTFDSSLLEPKDIEKISFLLQGKGKYSVQQYAARRIEVRSYQQPTCPIKISID
jgi:pyruvate formate lyase activating enzyme